MKVWDVTIHGKEHMDVNYDVHDYLQATRQQAATFKMAYGRIEEALKEAENCLNKGAITPDEAAQVAQHLSTLHHMMQTSRLLILDMVTTEAVSERNRLVHKWRAWEGRL